MYRKNILILSLAAALTAGVATIIFQEDLREKLGHLYYIVSLSMIACVLLVLSGYLWDKSTQDKIRALNRGASTSGFDDSSPPSGGEEDIMVLAGKIERMAQKLQRVEANYRALVEDQVDLICCYRPDGKLTFVNSAYADFFGKKRQELVGHPFAAVAPVMRKHQSGEFPTIFRFEFELDGAYGKSACHLWTNRAITESDGKLIEYQAVGHDITIRKKGETVLLRAKESAEDANRAKDMLLATISHEIRNPLSVIHGFVELLGKRTLKEDETRWVAAVARNLEGILILTNDLMDFSKIEAGGIELEHQPFDVRRCVEDVRAFFHPKALAGRLSLETHIDNYVPQTVIGDVHRLRQILVNLVSNALKFTSEGRVTIRVSAVIAAEEPGIARLQFAVKDTGIGIAPDKITTIFQPFHQADPSIARRYGGSGLGLSIASKLCELMHGAIQAESEPEKGSTFAFTIKVDLPLDRRDAEDGVMPLAPQSVRA